MTEHDRGKPVNAIEWTGPTLVDTEPYMNAAWLLRDRIKRMPGKPLIERRGGDGTWTPMTGEEFLAQVEDIAAGFVARGLNQGDAIAIMAPTCYEWTLLDFAALAAGLVVIPIYETSSPEQVRYMMSDADVRLVITKERALAKAVRDVAEQVPLRPDVIVIDDGATYELAHLGASDGKRAERIEEVRRRTAAATLDDVATIVYTSGTTGTPKGVELTHGNISILARNAALDIHEVTMYPGSRLLLFLPLAHVYARFLVFYQLAGEGVFGHTGMDNIVADMQSFKPTYILAVPRVLEKVYNAAEAKAGSSSMSAKIFAAAAETAVEYSRALDTPEGPGKRLRSRHKLFSKLVYSKIRTTLGGAVEFAVSGGGALGTHLGHFFRGIGLTVMEGYGLTESTAPCAVNKPTGSKIGTVGPPLATVSARIADDGEILLRGPSIFRGYHGDPELTAQSFTEDGWFHTGDLGTMDAEGRLHITGRIKDILVTAGKNVYPSRLEDALSHHPLIAQTVVVGDGKPFIGALIALDAEALGGWLANRKLPSMTPEEAAVNPVVRAEIQTQIDEVNASVSRAESIRKFRLLPTAPTLEDGVVTPTLKIKRDAFARAYAEEIDKLYRLS